MLRNLGIFGEYREVVRCKDCNSEVEVSWVFYSCKKCKTLIVDETGIVISKEKIIIA